jgi:hypothetical protein
LEEERMTERDPLDDADLPLDELRRAWSRIEAPSPQDDLAQCDQRTRAAVEWMRNAWSRVEVPEPVLPARSVRFRRAQRFVLPLAAAAGALVALGIWLALQRFAPGVRPESVSPQIAQQSTSAEGTTQEEGSAYLATGVEIASLAPDRLEVCSGSVCLILLTPQTSPQTP